MCWRSATLEKKIATEDIKTFKIAKKNNDDAIISLYNNFHYELNKLYNTNILISKIGEISIHVPHRIYIGTEGFHSYNISFIEISKRLNCIRVNIKNINVKNNMLLDVIPLDIIQSDTITLEKNIVKLDCIIPKSAEYYENKVGEIISNQIIIKNVESIWN